MPLSNVGVGPFTRGGILADEQQRARAASEMQQNLGNVGILAKIQQMQQAKKYQDLLGQGGDLETVLPRLIQSGAIPPEHLPALMKTVEEMKMRKGLTDRVAEINARLGGQGQPPAPIQPVTPGSMDFQTENNAVMGLPPPERPIVPAAPAQSARQTRIAHLTELEKAYSESNDPRYQGIAQSIRAQIDRLQPKTVTIGNKLYEYVPGEPPKEIASVPKEEASPEIVKLQKIRDAAPEGSRARAEIQKRIDLLNTRQPQVQVNMPSTSGMQIITGASLPQDLKDKLGQNLDPKKNYTVSVQVGRDNTVQMNLIGEAGARPSGVPNWTDLLKMKPPVAPVVRPGSAAPAPVLTIPSEIKSKFDADPAMKGNTLGTPTNQGVEVKDSAGKLIGYYR